MKYYPLILFLFSINLTFAQDSSKTLNKELKHGLEFQVGSHLTLTNFNNYTFSYRYCFNQKSGLRIGLYTNVNKEDDDITKQTDSLISNPSEYSHYYNFKISAQYLHSIMNYNSFSFIWGGGPFISYSKNESYTEYLSSAYINQYKRKENTFSFGIDLILGVEYELAQNVRLSGEYGLTISKANSDIDYYSNYTYNNGDPNRTNSENGESQTFTIRGLGVNLGLSIFF